MLREEELTVSPDTESAAQLRRGSKESHPGYEKKEFSSFI